MTTTVIALFLLGFGAGALVKLIRTIGARALARWLGRAALWALSFAWFAVLALIAIGAFASGAWWIGLCMIVCALVAPTPGPRLPSIDLIEG